MNTLSFSGYEWNVRGTNGSIGGPGPNAFAADCAQVEDCVLVLKTRKEGDSWMCAEVSLTEPFGYGEYTFSTSSVLPSLNSPHVFAAFLYENDTQELDIEFSGTMVGKNKGQFVVQPGSTRGNLSIFTASNSPLTSHSITWLPDRIQFKSWEGAAPYADAARIAAWTYEKEGIASPERARFILNLWLFRGVSPQRGAEVRITNFSFRAE